MNVWPPLTKLRTMTLREVGGRLGHQAFLRWERLTLQSGQDSPQELRRALRPDLAGTVGWVDDVLRAGADRRERMFASVAQPDTTRALLLDRFPGAVSRVRGLSSALLDGRLTVFGNSYELPANVDWHTAPGASLPWALVPHSELKPGNYDPRRRDVKFVWELNRHQWFLPLATTYLLDRDARIAARIDALVQSWLEQNPYGRGINWAGPLEVAYRALSWLWSFELIRTALPRTSQIRWLSGFLCHGRFLYRHLEWYSSPYNHLIGEAAVLFMMGVLLPEFAEAERWRRRGRDVLESRLAAQFHSDGGSVEQATVYHHATLGFYLLAAVLGRKNGHDLSSAVWRAIERGVEFSRAMMTPDGTQPMIGDNDDARPLAFGPGGWDFRHFLSTGAVLFDRADFKAASRGLHEDTVWLLGPSAAASYDRLANESPSDSSIVLRDSGYVVLRSGWEPTADYVCFDCGEQAAGLRRDGIPSAAHGHADALAVNAVLGGQPLLVDPGFYSYNGPEPWERFFRGTAAHNTINIDGLDQATYHGRMTWSSAPTVTLEAEGENDAGMWAIASHDGYASKTSGVQHRRTIWLLRAGLLVIYDELTADRDRHAEAVFQWHEGHALNAESSNARTARYDLAWAADTSVSPQVKTGADEPAGGWICPGLEQRRAAPRLSLGWPVHRGRSGLLTCLYDNLIWRLEHHTNACRLALLLRGPDRHIEIDVQRTGASVPDRQMDPGAVSAITVGETVLRVTVEATRSLVKQPQTAKDRPS